MNQPCSVAVGSGDVVYVLLRGSENISNVPWNQTGNGAKVGKYTMGTVPGDEELVANIGRDYGDGDGQFIWPAGIALDRQENIYVTDEWMNRISIFDKDGEFLGKWGLSGRDDGQFKGPVGIAIDQEDNLFIVDSQNHRVQKLTKDGKFLGKWGSLGSGDGELNAPWGITIDAQGYVYVADHKNHRVQKFTPEGEFLARFGSYGTGPGQVNLPTDVAVDPDGDVYVCDWANDRVQSFEPDGGFIATFVGDAQVPAKWHQQTIDANLDVARARRRVSNLEVEWRFAMPRALVFDSEKKRLLVADTQRGRLQIYNKLESYLDPQFNL